MNDLKIKNISSFINSYQFLSLPLKNYSGGFFVCDSEKEKNEVFFAINFLNNTIFQNDINVYYEININLIYDILDNKNFLCILSSSAIFKKIPSKKEFIKNIFSLKIGGKIKITEVVSKLLSLEYKYTSNIFLQKNEFKNYGDILEIFNSYDSKLYKIEFFGNVIEKIYTIDPEKKNKLDDTDNFSILPTNDVLNFGESFVSDYLNNKNYFVYNKNLIEDLDFLDLENSKNIFIENKFSTNFHIKKVSHYESDFIKLKNDINDFIKNKYEIIFFTFDKNNLVSTFKNNSINGEKIKAIEVKYDINFEGFIDNDNKKIFLCDNNVFYKRKDEPIKIEKIKSDDSIKNKVKKIEKKRKYFLSEIKNGDFIVHSDHGIGKFFGIVKNKIFDDIEKEYILIVYENDDKLYVPIELIDKVDKYVGKENPTLHRLSETEAWITRRNKIKEDIFKHAQELIAILAKRQISKIKPMIDYRDLEERLEKSFGYTETDDQLKAIKDVNEDMKSGTPMDRLICGDVGFGKTEIAMRAAFKAVSNGYQVMILCPTTILSQQHFDTFCERLNEFGINIALLNRFNDAANKKNNVIEDIKNGKYEIIIGTHRLLSKDVGFKNLGLVIIDEEQKFGSISKERLKKYRNNIHVLAMSATPIPRTLNLSLSGIYNMSVITTPPKERLNILSYVEKYDEDLIRSSIQKELDRHGQAYYLYNKVETIDIAKHKLNKILPEARFGIAHGQMKAEELISVFEKFDKREIDVLLCTTIIENGIDLPNVNTLIVENCENFGLAQLHQLRGRVGRSNKQGYCYFLYRNEKMNEDARKRLDALIDANKIGDGFKIASYDMEIRGVGNLLGEQQHGHACAIGLSLYSKLLEQAIQKINTGIEENIDFETRINLPINFRIPDSVISDEVIRMKTYQKISMIDDIDELKKEINILEKNYKEKDDSLYNLENIFKLKIFSKKLNINQIDFIKFENINTTIERIVLTFENDINENIENNFYSISKYFNKKERQMRIDLEYLGKDWFKNLVSYLEKIYNM